MPSPPNVGRVPAEPPACVGVSIPSACFPSWQGELDELEREEFFRLKKVQGNKKKNADAAVVRRRARAGGALCLARWLSWEPLGAGHPCRVSLLARPWPRSTTPRSSRRPTTGPLLPVCAAGSGAPRQWRGAATRRAGRQGRRAGGGRRRRDILACMLPTAPVRSGTLAGLAPL